MEYKRFYIGSLSSIQWKNVFLYCINFCNKFTIHFPEELDGDEKVFYLGLKEIQHLEIKPWNGCKNFIEIKGILNDRTKTYFKKYLEDSLNEDSFELWDYQFLYGDREVLYVGDCIDKLVCYTDKELEEIKQLDIDFSVWDELNIAENNTIKAVSIDVLEEIIPSFISELDKITKD